jgi:predicted dehydrogenase
LKVLIIGYGSIGRRHEEILSKFSGITFVDLVTKQNIENKKTFDAINNVSDIQSYDYFVIASETHKHNKQLKYLEENVTDKIIFCEKPLFEINKDLKIEKNQVFVGYVLRFHPMLQKLKSFLHNEKVLSVNVNCGQYLPTWRPNTDYRNSYSAKKDEGGGVLLDLSHEIDYIQWLFGTMKEIKSYQLKISDLEIDTDDLTTLIGKTDKEIIINLSIDYISKITYRKMLIHTLNATYELDFIKNNLIQKDKAGLEQVYTFTNLERNYMFEEMHKSILSHKESVCSYDEGLQVMNTISIIQEQNK